MDNLKKAVSKRLKSLEDNLTAQDKLDAMEHMGISRPTLDKYLQGNAVKIDVATELLKFLSNRVQQRINDLRAVNVA